jgi:hypothetical protein
MRLIGVLAVVGVFSLTMCALDQGNASVDAARSTLVDLAARLDNDEIGRVEIVFVPPRVLTRIPITPEAIETIYDYKFTIRDLRNGLYHRELADAVKALSLESRDGLPDVRWGVIFLRRNRPACSGDLAQRNGERGRHRSESRCPKRSTLRLAPRSVFGDIPLVNSHR